MAAGWYLRIADREFGPVPAAQLAQMARIGRIRPDDLLRKGPTGQWVEASHVKGLTFASADTVKPQDDFAAHGHAAQPSTASATIAGNCEQSAPQRQDNANVADSVPVPTTTDGLHVAAGKGNGYASSLAARGKAAAQLVAKQTERAKLTKITLPNAYRALGKHVHNAGSFRAEFVDICGRIDTLLAEVAQLSVTGPTVEGFAEKAKAVAEAAKNKTHTHALNLKVNHAYTELGNAAFQKHGESSGPADLIKPILDCRARLEKLAAEIVQVSQSQPGVLLTPKRLAIGGLVATGGLAVSALLLVLVVKATSFGGRTQAEQNAEGFDQWAQQAMQQQLETERLQRMARNGQRWREFEQSQQAHAQQRPQPQQQYVRPPQQTQPYTQYEQPRNRVGDSPQWQSPLKPFERRNELERSSGTVMNRKCHWCGALMTSDATGSACANCQNKGLQ